MLKEWFRNLFVEYCNVRIEKMVNSSEYISDYDCSWVGSSRYLEVGRQEDIFYDLGRAWVRLTRFGLLAHLEVATGRDATSPGFTLYVSRDFTRE